MIAYREIFKPEEVLLNETTYSGDQYSSMLKAQYIRLIPFRLNNSAYDV